MKISLELLQIIDTIDRQGSFSAAALALHRVPSALSHAVAKLESELGTPLFTRQGRRALLNPAGQALLDDGRHLLRAARELERRVQRIGSGWEAELRIAIDAALPSERLYPLLADFYASAPPTQIRLSSEVLSGTWDALLTDRADLVIGAPGERPPRSGIASRPLGQVSLSFVIAPSHPLANWPGPIPNEELARHRAVVIADTARELNARTIGLQDGQAALRVPDMYAKLSAQVAGLGIGHLPHWLAAPDLARGRLVECTLCEPPPALPCHIGWRTRQMGSALQWFIDALAQPPWSGQWFD
ncbi:MAG: LysR family transcriptional regulator [Dechloromonas sp.]|nr:LysR family transcriptional regulator [Dechloromonas sp.]